ncbi:MAG: hypothetical protein DSM107014_15520 [Gomphosphaeria aponina SAG 52.96 = DSM 107014]|uniref:Polysaccharide biosynthesis enzyme WcbI domain-containing protein n=1 Tax=Gomphosphaeria aponina SAG 52.96 = DSM 107014 TaxID=1521640 RepID=A0A941GXS3_9CHRO|nr:hypothetical protein [Gomphosphaeria aponina SAG 52.96 = DSM 107014]
MKLKYSVYGNCQANALARSLNLIPEFRKRYNWIPCKAVQNINKNEITSILDIISSLDLIIYQNVSENYYRMPELSTNKILGFLPNMAVKISIPSFYFNGYFPHLDSLLNLQSITNLVHDYNVLGGYVQNIPENDLYEIISDDNFYSKEEVLNYCEISLRNLANRESQNNIDVRQKR